MHDQCLLNERGEILVKQQAVDAGKCLLVRHFVLSRVPISEFLVSFLENYVLTHFLHYLLNLILSSSEL
jgi:hypothetical protein